MTRPPECRAVPAFAEAPSVPSALPVRSSIAAAACACAGLAALVFACDPSRHGFYPECPLYRATGLYCAGCGATRALYALLHGRFGPALHDNALFVLALPVAAAVALPWLARSWRDRAWAPGNLPSRALIPMGFLFLALLLLFAVARNLPGMPFDLLRPL